MQDDKVVRFESIFNKTSDQLYGFIKGMIRNSNLVQDFMQQCYMKLWEKFDETDLEREVLPLLYTYARNMVIDHLRKKVREESIADYTIYENDYKEGASVLDAIISKENEENLHAVINRMPSRRKEVFTLIKLQGLTYQEVGSKLSISVSTVEKHMHEAYKFLAAWSSTLLLSSLLIGTIW